MTGAAALIPTYAYYAWPWLLALAIAVVASLVRPRVGPVRGLGLGLMTVPLARTLLGIVDSFGPLLQGGFTLRAYTTYQLSSLYISKFLTDLGYLGVGFLLFAYGHRVLRATPQGLARHLARRGFPMGGRGEGRSGLVGLVTFPVLLLGTLAVNLATADAESLRQSDESSVFANMTLYHAALISAAAAVGEELVYRGLLQTLLLGGGRRLLGPRSGAVARGLVVGGAIAVQAIVFGFAHSGYATWIHVLLPTLFGVVAGIAAWRFGIWSAIVLHFVVDVYAFVAEVAARQPMLWTVLTVAFVLNLALTLGVGIAWLVRRNETRHAAA